MTATSTAAKGKVIAVHADHVVFQPAGTNYELHLKINNYTGKVGVPVDCVIRANARKIYSVPSGGNFVQPIFGPPKIIQGRVRAIEGSTLIIHAGAAFHITLPASPDAIDMNSGDIAEGSMVNVVALPGATAEFR